MIKMQKWLVVTFQDKVMLKVKALNKKKQNLVDQNNAIMKIIIIIISFASSSSSHTAMAECFNCHPDFVRADGF